MLIIRLLFALTSFASSTLMFWVEPMIGKMLLPYLGGTPAVWNTCLVFFQAMLLAGYAWAHASTRWLGIRKQAAVQAALMLGVILLPAPIVDSSAARGLVGSDPIVWLLFRLTVTIGPAFFVLAALGPLLQRWFASMESVEAEGVLSLYAASNLGSLSALIAYPLAIEPMLPLTHQARLWRVSLCGLFLLILACAVATWWQGRRHVDRPADVPASGRQPWLRWVTLAFVPSSLLLGVTTYLTTDIAPVPLLWVIPLALYLMSFVVVFSRRPAIPHEWALRALPISALLLAPAIGAGLVWTVLLPLHLATFFLAALACHGELVKSRPMTRDLTGFYLALGAGGALGGVFNALIAPHIFSGLAEYPLGIVLALLAAPVAIGMPRRDEEHSPLRWVRARLAIPAVVFVLVSVLVQDVARSAESILGVALIVLASGLALLAVKDLYRRPAQLALTLGAFWLACSQTAGPSGRLLHRERDVFGVLRVTHEPKGDYHRLLHGNTLHGQQSFEPSRKREPVSYYTEAGPMGQILADRPRRARIAVVGLGIGTLAAYAREGESWTFYELDPAVIRIARDPRYFSFLDDAAVPMTTIVGDARLRLNDAPESAHYLIVMDAFSSDAVPTHLLTREAFQLYRSRLQPGGRIVFNLSNRYLDLEPVVGTLARDSGMACRIRRDLDVSPEEKRQGKQSSIWAVVVAKRQDFGQIATDDRWRVAREGGSVWTDDYSDVARHLLILKHR